MEWPVSFVLILHWYPCFILAKNVNVGSKRGKAWLTNKRALHCTFPSYFGWVSYNSMLLALPDSNLEDAFSQLHKMLSY